MVCGRAWSGKGSSAEVHTCHEHAPSDNGYEEVAGLADKLERSGQVKKSVDVLHNRHT